MRLCPLCAGRGAATGCQGASCYALGTEGVGAAGPQPVAVPRPGWLALACRCLFVVGVTQQTNTVRRPPHTRRRNGQIEKTSQRRKRAFLHRKFLSLVRTRKTEPKPNRTSFHHVTGLQHVEGSTLPPGARCLAVSLFELMSGLRLPWHRRRTTRRLRADFMLVHALLSANLGRGYYSYAHFRPAPPVWTDASKQARYTGGGWVSACGAYDYFKYGSRAARQPIDFLEGDTVVACVERLAQ